MTGEPGLAQAPSTLTAPGQPFEMEDVEVRGAPVRAWKLTPPSLRAVFDQSLAHGEADYLVHGDRRMSYAEHYRTCATLAHRLRHQLGVGRGDRVAIAMGALPEWVVAFWATVVAGAVAVPLDASWSADDLVSALADSGSAAAFVDAEHGAVVTARPAALPALRAVVVVGRGDPRGATAQTTPEGQTTPEDRATPEVHTTPGVQVSQPAGGGAGPAEWSFERLLGAVDPQVGPPDVDLSPDDDATIVYTSGTTGRPRGVVGTHRNACTTLMSQSFLAAQDRWQEEEEEEEERPENEPSANQTRGGDDDPGSPDQATAGEVPAPTGEPGAGTPRSGDDGAGRRCWLLAVPLSHALGCQAALLTATAAGAAVVLAPHLDAEAVLALVERHRVTTFVGTPTVVLQVLESAALARRDVSSVRSVSFVGAPAPPDLARRIRRAFPRCQPTTGYGTTETSGVTTGTSGDDCLRRPDSVGLPVPVAEVAVVPDDWPGTEPPAAEPGTVGELWVKGPQVARGYWGRPDDTASAFTGGWFHTGDLARVDGEGLVTVVDRVADVVVRGGEPVYSGEVESVLSGHPAVAECAVVGVPHPVLGQEVGAVVVLRRGHKVGADELGGHVRHWLAGPAVPTRLWFRQRPLPRGPAGTVTKRVLRAEVFGAAGPS